MDRLDVIYKIVGKRLGRRWFTEPTKRDIDLWKLRYSWSRSYTKVLNDDHCKWCIIKHKPVDTTIHKRNLQRFITVYSTAWSTKMCTDFKSIHFRKSCGVRAKADRLHIRTAYAVSLQPGNYTKKAIELLQTVKAQSEEREVVSTNVTLSVALLKTNILHRHGTNT